MILVYWKVQKGFQRYSSMYQEQDYRPVYIEGNQKFHTGVTLEHIKRFIALHQEVQEKNVIICNVMDDYETGNGFIRIRGSE